MANKDTQRGLIFFAALFALAWHPIITLIFLPTIVAVARGHRNPFLVFVLNVVFGVTPAWLLIMLYAVQKKPLPPRRHHTHHATITI